MQSEPYVLALKYHPEESCYIARIKNVTAIPDDFSLMVSDIVHAMRSSLDNIVYAIATRHLGRMPTHDEAIPIQFVIVDQIGAWKGQCERRLRHLPPPAQTLIEGFQPYHRPDPTERHALSVLRDLSNVDKHRHILVALAIAQSSGVLIESSGVPPGTYVAGYSGPIKEGTMIARWKFSGIPEGFYPDMSVQGKLAFDVTFPNEWPAWGGSVLGYLTHMHRVIDTLVFPPMEQFLV